MLSVPARLRKSKNAIVSVGLHKALDNQTSIAI